MIYNIIKLLIDENFLENFPRIHRKENKEISIHNETCFDLPKSINLTNQKAELFNYESLSNFNLLQLIYRMWNSILQEIKKNNKLIKKYHASFWYKIKEDFEKYKNGKINILKLILEIFKKVIKKLPEILETIIPFF